MQLQSYLLIIGVIGLGLSIAIAVVLKSEKKNTIAKQPSEKITEQMEFTAIKTDVNKIFNDEFREEMRNRGRLYFEKIISENAMFLQQDLRLTTSHLNDYMKQEITKTLKEEFSKYEQSINDAKQLAIDSIAKTQKAIEEQREILGKQLNEQVASEKERVLSRFEKNMAEIVNHYVLEAIGNQIDLNDQLEFILGELEANKKEIIEDIKNGA